MAEDKKIIFSMTGVSKTFSGANRPVLKDIYLSFFYGAKIGIRTQRIRKSTPQKIIAGVDKSFQGDVVFNADYKIGYLEQEPRMEDNKTVLEVVKEGTKP